MPKNATIFSCFSLDEAIASFRSSKFASLLLMILMATFCMMITESSFGVLVRIPLNTSPNAPDPKHKNKGVICMQISSSKYVHKELLLPIDLSNFSCDFSIFVISTESSHSAEIS